MPLVTPTAIDGWSTSHATNHARSTTIAQDHKENPRSGFKSPTLIGQSPVMRKLFSVIERVAPTDASVLITGATGTGKELAARAIHDQVSNRRPRESEHNQDGNYPGLAVAASWWFRIRSGIRTLRSFLRFVKLAMFTLRQVTVAPSCAKWAYFISGFARRFKLEALRYRQAV